MDESLNITGAPTNRIAALVNRVEPFEFEFDGEKVSGTWYKYKTTTPRYQLARQKLLEEITGRISAIPDQVKDIADADEKTAKQAELEKQSEDELKAYAFQYFTDTIHEWKDQDGQPIELTVDTFQDLPEPFTEAMAQHFKKLRDEAVNPTKSANSQNG